MAQFKTLVPSYLLLCLLSFSSSYAQTCSNNVFSNNIFSTCTALPVQNAFLHWTYHNTNHTVDIAYRHTGVATDQWVAWALNIVGSRMIGSQSLVGFVNSSGVVRAYTSPVRGYDTTLAEGPLSFEVPVIRGEYDANNNVMIIFATLRLPGGGTRFNQVWQIGQMAGGSPGGHGSDAANVNAMGTVDFSTGQTSADNGGNSRLRKRNIHGVLNVVSWGILLPLGAMTARYMKVFHSADPAWFYIHVVCQTSAYIVGVAGWATGIKLGSDSPGIVHNPHRNIGIALFSLGTLQVLALLMRPKKDHKLRLYWNLYHYAVGYVVIALSIRNVFGGFDILQPDEKWRRAYIGVLIFLGVITVILEAITWCIVLKRKKSDSNKHQHGSNGNGVNGYGA